MINFFIKEKNLINKKCWPLVLEKNIKIDVLKIWDWQSQIWEKQLLGINTYIWTLERHSTTEYIFMAAVEAQT